MRLRKGTSIVHVWCAALGLAVRLTPKETRPLRIRAGFTVPESKLPTPRDTWHSFAAPHALLLFADFDPFSPTDGPALSKLAAN